MATWEEWDNKPWIQFKRIKVWFRHIIHQTISLYTNKIFKAKNLNESQKVKVLSSFDKAKNVGEVKMVFETLNEGIKVSKNTIKENLGSASKGTMTPSVKKPIVESNEAFLRMQKLAGII